MEYFVNHAAESDECPTISNKYIAQGETRIKDLGNTETEDTTHK